MTVEIFDAPDTDKTTEYRVPTWGYVSQLFMQLQWELQGQHTKMSDIEALKYYEDEPGLHADEKKTGEEVHIGLTAELLENVKAAILANMPRVKVQGLRQKEGKEENQGKREKYWQKDLDEAAELISELVDAQLLGFGVLKNALIRDKWDAKTRRRKSNEHDDEYTERVNAYKRLWGPPMGAVTVHPIAFYYRPGEGSRVEECIEQGYVAKRKVIKKYEKVTQATLGQDLKDIMQSKSDELGIITTPTQPNEFIRPLPMGMDTAQYFVVTQYWNPECYQVYVNQQLVHQELGTPSVCYHMAFGRTSSSKDGDKLGISVAESLRVMEPVINRMMTRMVEAADLIVNKRNTLEVPESYTPESETNSDGSTVAKKWEFTDEYADALPAGAHLVDAYQGAEAVYQGMPLLQLLLQIVGQHGVTPLFKGISPGAAGSGYRDNSLYLMAKQQFQYIILSLQKCLTDYIRYREYLIAYKLKQEVYLGELSLSPADIKDWPAEITVELKPTLPQNRIADGEFGMSMHQAGGVTMRRVREEFLGIEQPDEEEFQRDLEDMKSMAKQYMFMELLSTTTGLGGNSGLVGPDGQTPISSDSTTAATNALGGGTGAGQTLSGRGAQRNAGYATGGQPKSPTQEPGATPKRTMENG